MQVLFIFIWSLVLCVPQSVVRFDLFGFHLGLEFSTVLLIYLGLNLPVVSGLIATALLSFLVETFSFAPHGYLVLANAILFIGIFLLREEIYTEAYLTKSFWVFVFSLANHFLTALALANQDGFVLGGHYWVWSLAQSLLNGGIALPLFIALDISSEGFLYVFSKKPAHVTGADLYQVKSDQRKFLR